MLFNSLEFFFFLPIVFCLYWFVFNKNARLQNLLILISSYLFYGWWDWRFLTLILFSTIVDYLIGLKIYDSKESQIKKIYLWVSILFNLSLLGFFKYFNFFIGSWIELLNLIGYSTSSTWTLNVILPVGISFYTFQTMSYSLDIYFKKLKPTKDFISFASFVSFFPQVVAGPIERASNLLPQILKKRVFKYEQGVQGLRLILWGMFKKVVIADSLGWRVDYVFDNYQTLDGGTLFLGLVYFSIQIYCDFSGYSDIAIGTAKLLGVELMSNFKFPYFSRNIEEFWRRWHISLTSWFRDYVYIPLFSKIDDDDIIYETTNYKIRAIKITIFTFLISGLWHGANWTFILWGLTHALLYLPIILSGKSHSYNTTIIAQNKWFPSFKEILQMGTTFFSVTITWVFFRAETISEAFQYLILMITKFSIPLDNRSGILFIFVLIIFDWLWRVNERTPININNKFIRIVFYYLLIITILSNNATNQTFIYFQF